MVGVLIVIITILLFVGTTASKLPQAFCYGRAIAFFVGAIFSATVGFVGMRLATVGNLRVAAAAKTSFGRALQLGYRTGTITGMLTDGLGLLGGSIIFLTFGEQAYEALLGFGFGGTLLALFMRVGGGIYTKAADVGADLVGKVEAGIPRTTRVTPPRSPTTSATTSATARNGRRHLRELRSDDRGGHDLGHRQFRAQGRHFPLVGPRYRRDRQHHQHL